MISMAQLRRVLRAALPLSLFSAGVAWLVTPPSSSEPDGSTDLTSGAATAPNGSFLPYVWPLYTSPSPRD